MLTIACRDVGQPCDCVLSGESEEELLKNAAEHAVNDHGYKEEEIMTPEMQQNIRSHFCRYRYVLTYINGLVNII
jgi:predicted small metal-binding protein